MKLLPSLDQVLGRPETRDEAQSPDEMLNALRKWAAISAGSTETSGQGSG